MSEPTRSRKKPVIAILSAAAVALVLGVVVKDESGQPLLGNLLQGTKTNLNEKLPAETAKTDTAAVDAPKATDSASGSDVTVKPADPEVAKTEEAKPDETSPGEAAKAEIEDQAALTAQEEVAKPEPVTPEPQVAPAEMPIPTFDILRVEPDGSVVIAGKAAPGSMVEIVDVGSVLAKGAANAAGDFAIIFDEPLTAGDHELQIRAKSADGNTVVSEESGVVSVPKPGGVLMAMIAKPGEASRIVQKPTVIGEDPAKPDISGETKVSDEPVKPAEQETEIASVEPDTSKLEPVEESNAAVAEENKEAVIEPVEKPAEAAPEVLVGAIDVEPDAFFIAGTGKAGSAVNIYIDNQLMGSTVVGPEGAFLFKGDGRIEPGEHIVRADMLVNKNADVSARAEVTLQHALPEKAPEVAQLEPEKPAEEAVTAVKSEAKSGDTGTMTFSSEVPAKPAVESKAPETVVQATEPAKPVEPATAKEPVVQEVTKAPAPSEPVKTDTGNGTAEVTIVEKTPDTVSPEVKETEVAAVESKSVKPVIKSGQSVIIRRGDNLWTISRRMLGEGRRYTTIYEANSDQIKNPHWIFPGQVFMVPEKEE